MAGGTVEWFVGGGRACGAIPRHTPGWGGRACIRACFPGGETESTEISLTWRVTGGEAGSPPGGLGSGSSANTRVGWPVSKTEIIIFSV